MGWQMTRSRRNAVANVGWEGRQARRKCAAAAMAMAMCVFVRLKFERVIDGRFKAAQVLAPETLGGMAAWVGPESSKL
jgi:hypothetical protein